MKVCLMFRDRDFELPAELRTQQEDLAQDIGLQPLLEAMAGDDGLVFKAAQAALIGSFELDASTVRYRQGILRDAIQHPGLIKEMYDLTAAALEGRRRHYFGVLSNYPSGTLRMSMEIMHVFVDILHKLRDMADVHAGTFESEGFTTMLAMLQAEFSDAYFAEVEQHLADLELPRGVLMSARLGAGNDGMDYVLRMPKDAHDSWLSRLLRKGPPSHTFRVAERDEAGFRALSELRDRGLDLAANALAQSAEHILSFFEVLRLELAFYIGCLNLRDRLAAIVAPIVFPEVQACGAHALKFAELYDASLALSMGHAIVGNAVDTRSAPLVIITGANQGGKSSFLRSVGLAQAMMQSGMFVAAESFAGELCTGLFTHYKREEDDTLSSGKFDEELARMSTLADEMQPGALALFNESFASTNEREGSDVARQIVRAMLEAGIRVFFVTHLYDLSHSYVGHAEPAVHFLRAERNPDGSRPFRLVEAEPLDTSYGEDLYREIFGAQASVG